MRNGPSTLGRCECTHARRLNGWGGGHCPTEVALWLISDNISFFTLSLGPLEAEMYFQTVWLKMSERGWKSAHIVAANAQYALPPQDFFFILPKGPRVMFWAKMAPDGPPGTPRKSAFFYERGWNRMKEWRKVTFKKEWLKAPDITVILSYWGLLDIFSLGSYGCLKKKMPV